MPTVALIGPELYPIPPIRGGAAELFIEKVAELASRAGGRWSSGYPIPTCRARRPGAGGVFPRPPQGWRRWLYCRYRHYFPLYDREVARIVQPRPAGSDSRPQPAAAGPVPGAPRSAGPSPSSCTCTTFMSPWGNGSAPARARPSRWRALPPAATSSWSGSAPGWGWARRAFGSSITGWRPGPLPPCGTMTPQRQQVREHYGLADEPTVLFAGKLRESKGVHILLRAMARVWEDRAPDGAGPGGRHRIRPGPHHAGDPVYGPELRRDLARAPGRVVLTGFIPPG